MPSATKISEPLKEQAELLFRQATQPGWIRDGRPTSQLFEPRPNDKGKVSVDRESIVGTAQASLEAFLANGFKSASTWGVKVGEVNAERLEAHASPSMKNKAHAHVDMSKLRLEEQRLVATHLVRYADKRGRLAPELEKAVDQSVE